MDKQKADCEEVVRLLSKEGRETSAEYIRQIAFGYKRPSYDFAKDLSKVTRIPVAKIMDHCDRSAA